MKKPVEYRSCSEGHHVMTTLNSDHPKCANYEKTDIVMYFDPEFELWFKCRILKVTENFFIVSSHFVHRYQSVVCSWGLLLGTKTTWSSAWRRRVIGELVLWGSETGVVCGFRLESESDTEVEWSPSTEVHAGYIRVRPTNIPVSIQVLFSQHRLHSALYICSFVSRNWKPLKKRKIENITIKPISHLTKV